MKTYQVEYKPRGKTKEVAVIDAASPGSAFSKCHKLHPTARILRCVLQTHLAGRINFPSVWIEYEPPKRCFKERPPASQDPKLVQSVMPFA